MKIELPKLKKVNLNKKKILLLSDDLRLSSGVATISKEIVIQTAHKYNWVQLGAALNHPDHGKVFDLSDQINKDLNINDGYVKIYAHTGYGSQDVIREVIQYEKPDMILLITDPRFFGFVFLMEHELRTRYKIPIGYLQIWDNLPVSYWNAQAYASCDLLMSINRQTKVINQECLNYHNTDWWDLDDSVGSEGPNKPIDPILLSYVPHGLNPNIFYKQTPDSKDWNEFVKFRDDFKTKNDVDFIVFYNSRNIRRKQPGDIILSFKRFCDQLPKEQSSKCCLLMHTQIADENGTDLMAVKRVICPEYKIIFNQELLPPNVLNWMYNMSDCTIFMSSAEGFGLAANESLLCGTMIIAPVTGGLQDQMRFEDEFGNWVEVNSEFVSNHRGKYKKCGKWAYSIFPRARLLQGSIPTPYIFDDVCDSEDAAIGLKYIYDLGVEQRDINGLEGQSWVLSEESGMSGPEMGKRFIDSVDALFDEWTPKFPYQLIEVTERKQINYTGIEW